MCRFKGGSYKSEVGDLFDYPQLYKTFQFQLDQQKKIFVGQVLHMICQFDVENKQVNIIGDIPGLEVQAAEEGYAHLCQFNGQLMASNGHELFVYTQRKEGDKLWFDPVRVYCDNGADLVVFSYLMNTIVFDTTKQLIYSVKGDKNDGKLRLDELPKPEERVVPEQKNVIALEKVCETQTQLILFQNKYLLLTDGEQPTPLCEVFDMKTHQLVETEAQNWFQDNFWSYLEVNRFGELELDHETFKAVQAMMAQGKAK